MPLSKPAIRARLAALATITLYNEPEDTPIRGNAIASGDDAIDRETEDALIADVESGNDWAWCIVIVRASFAGQEGYATLGACSYKSAADFEANSDYYEDMREQALDNLTDDVHYLLSELGCTLTDLEDRS
jgi:hypothetical protein